MREHQVTRDEVQLDKGRGKIQTVPLDACVHDTESGWDCYVPIAELFTDLLADMQRNYTPDLKGWRRKIEQHKKWGYPGDLEIVDKMENNPPKFTGLAEIYYSAIHRRYHHPLRKCKICGKVFAACSKKDQCEFFYPHLRCCSNHCLDIYKKKRQQPYAQERHARISQDRALDREGMTCENCGVELDAQRSTRKFCSDRCRIAGNRKRKKQVGE